MVARERSHLGNGILNVGIQTDEADAPRFISSASCQTLTVTFRQRAFRSEKRQHDELAVSKVR